MKHDIVINNGHIIDPAQQRNGVDTVAIKGRRIVLPGETPLEADKTIDATGCYVFPGLIDFHCHLFYGQSISVYPDLMIPTGVTMAVDAGSSGCANYDAFQRSIINNCQLKVKSFLNVYGAGMVDDNIMENYDLNKIKPDNIKRIFDKYPSRLLGLKVRVSIDLMDDLRMLEETIKLADALHTKVCVHPTNPAGKIDDIIQMLRPGDIYAHMYQGKGDTILDSEKQVKESIKQARKRGVLFDVANGRWHLDFDTALSAIQDGFKPDIISTDQTQDKINYLVHAKNLPVVMSKFLMLGLTMEEIVAAVTSTPAEAAGLKGQIGTLAAGSIADVSIFKIIAHPIRHRDYKNTLMEDSRLFVPMMTILDGEIAYCRTEFNL